MILVLTVFELEFVLAFMWTSVNGWHKPDTQILQSQLLFMVFFLLGIILALYRRYFMADVMVVKVRNKKYEDFIDPSRVPQIE